jgi:uncharacterized coiled-coil DUF342 family protein
MNETPDAVARTKRDPNRSFREDALVAEIERLREEAAVRARVVESAAKVGEMLMELQATLDQMREIDGGDGAP